MLESLFFMLFTTLLMFSKKKTFNIAQIIRVKKSLNFKKIH